ncbi:MAG: efflux RND transporter periplasmic adaptor subunit [Bryobacterales bacterium]|nr:efflux RND transporter periplasmic adaptor subunit [Bryobacteraceae bacterium]MDW8354890.1 efflux RND transporter periplasmic adaptor subunit [Bryobacterales bacterium]
MRFAVALMLLIGTVSCTRAPERAATAPEGPIPVTTHTVAFTDWPVVYETVGTVRPRWEATVAAKVMGYVREVHVREGDRVRQGQSLVMLDSRDLEAAYRQAEAALHEAKDAVPEADNGVAAAKANLELAEVTLRRMRDLFEKKSVSNQEFDEAAARHKAAQAAYEMALAKRRQLDAKIRQAEQALEAARITRSYANIEAPFDGRVTTKHVDPGDLATPGAPLLTLEREGAWRLEAPVAESQIIHIRPGHRVTVVLEALGRTVESRVVEVVPAVDPAARSYTVKMDLPSVPGLHSGMFGRARFALGTRQALAIPLGAIQERGQLQSVFVAEGGFARTRMITAGSVESGLREVLSGLNAGERVIVPIPAGLRDGVRVEARP